MLNKPLLVLLSLTIISPAFAAVDVCPPSNAFRHVAIGAPWDLSDQYSALGWYISQTPEAKNAQVIPSVNNPLHVIVSADNDRNIYYITCKYELLPSMPQITLNVHKDTPQAAPSNNSNYKLVDQKKYVCNTSINNPGYCSSIIYNSQVIYNTVPGSIN
jgi:hypothetical protein